MPSSYTADAILLVRSLAKMGYQPRAIVSQAAGFQQQAFLDAVGSLAEGVFSRSSFALDTLVSRPAIVPVNARYRARTGRDLSDNASRTLVALQVLADAIDRAGTVDPSKLRAALLETRLDGAETIMPWRGVRFDKSGQNVDCTPVVQQVSGGVYRTVYPFDIAVRPPVWRVGT
jgi:branched-chain amino acid transport system substrate-binding protein